MFTPVLAVSSRSLFPLSPLTKIVTIPVRVQNRTEKTINKTRQESLTVMSLKRALLQNLFILQRSYILLLFNMQAQSTKYISGIINITNYFFLGNIKNVKSFTHMMISLVCKVLYTTGVLYSYTLCYY